jgi:RNA polymerase sigma factor (sigma-70 family)
LRRGVLVEATDEVCSQGHPLVILRDGNGPFLTCALLPEHTDSRPLPGEELELEKNHEGGPDIHDEIADNDATEGHQSELDQLLSEWLERADHLTSREQRVLQLRFGLEDGRARTLEEIGREFNCTQERIRQIEQKALRRLRHPSNFIACPRYPPVKATDEVCSLGHPMVIRLGRNGRFLACSLFPEHKESRPIPGEEPEVPASDGPPPPLQQPFEAVCPSSDQDHPRKA